MKKKILSVLLATAMVASMAACSNSNNPSQPSNASQPSGSGSGESNTPAPEEKYVLENLHIVVDGTITATVDSGQDEFIKQWEAAVSERLGHPIKLTIDQLDHSDYAGTVSRYLLTGTPGDGQYPDALIMSASMFREYAPTGLLWNMADAYDHAEFQNRLELKGVNENMKTASGELYGFAPTYGNGCVTYVKQSWLDAVGKKIDDIKTFDDYYALLKEFHDADPDGDGTKGKTYGVIAAGFGKLDEAPFINYMPEFWQGAYPDFYQKDGKWVDGFQEQATIDALDRLAKAYKDGLIDPDTEDAGTKQAREKFFSNDQSTSEGVFTYWAGTWLRTLTDNMSKNELDDALGDDRLVQLPPIKEIKDSWGGYINREAPVWVITDDGDGSNAREQAIFDALLDTMLDGDVVQTLWTYGAEDVHWSTKAETFTTNANDPEKKKDYTYEEGVFHLKQSPNDPNTIWKKNHLDSVLVIAPLTNGFVSDDPLVTKGNKFFTDNCVDAPAAASCETLTEVKGDLAKDKQTWMNQAVTGEITGAQAVEAYKAKYGDTSAKILTELNAQ